MGELLSPAGLDGASWTSDSLDELYSNEDPSLFLNADFTLPVEELVAQSSSLFGCDVEINTASIPLETQNSPFHADVVTHKSLTTSQMQERKEKLLLASAIFYLKYKCS